MSTPTTTCRARRARRRRPAPGRPRAARTRTRAQPNPSRAECVARRSSRAPAKPGRSDFTVEGVGNLLAQTRALLPAAAGRTDRRLPDARQRRHRCIARAARPTRGWPPRNRQRAFPVEWGGQGGGHEVGRRDARARSQVAAQGPDQPDRAGQRARLRHPQRSRTRQRPGAPQHAPARERLRALSALLGKLAAVPGVEDARRAT